MKPSTGWNILKSVVWVFVGISLWKLYGLYGAGLDTSSVGFWGVVMLLCVTFVTLFASMNDFRVGNIPASILFAGALGLLIGFGVGFFVFLALWFQNGFWSGFNTGFAMISLFGMVGLVGAVAGTPLGILNRRKRLRAWARSENEQALKTKNIEI